MSSTHEYLSTGCFHGRHDYCNDMNGYQGRKRAAMCKFCDARCTCPCHQNKTPPAEAKSTPGSITVGPGQG